MPDSNNFASILINVLLQVTLLSGLLLLAMWWLRGRAVWCYHLAYTGLLAVLVLAISSAWMQARDLSPWTLQLPLFSLTDTLAIPAAVDELDASEASQFQLEPPPPANLDQLLAEMFTLFSDANPPGTEVGTQITVAHVLVSVWLAGILIGLMGLGVSGYRLRRLIQRARAPGDSTRDKLIALSRQIHRHLAPDFLLSSLLHSPVHVGFFKPIIVLPEDIIAKCDDAQMQAVITHELAHWIRRDNLANLVQQVIVTLFWFHPLIHRLGKLASQSREEICDNHVLARQDPICYSETLLWLSSRERAIPNNSVDQRTAVAMFTHHWRLEQRIRELLDNNRETTMQLSTHNTHIFRISLLAFTFLIASFTLVPELDTVAAQSSADQEDRSPPQARTTETLSETIMESVTEIQELLTARPDSDSGEGLDPEAAKAQLDALYDAEFAVANSFERSTILNFYTNYYLMEQDYPQALQTFEQILAIEGLREDIELRTLRSLGQLYAAEERWQDSLNAYTQWRELSDDEDAVVFRGMAYDHYQLDSYQESRDFWIQYMQMRSSEDLSRDDYAYLNGLHFMLDDLPSALALTKEMILRFNEQTDWDNLRAIYELIDDQNALADLDPELGSTLMLQAQEPQIAFAHVVPTDGDYLPLSATAPMYPRVAAEQEIEGWVLVSFTVGIDGQVEEESIEVIDAEPTEVFNAASIRATREFLFSPRMQAGEPVPVPGVQYLFRFRLSDDDV